MFYDNTTVLIANGKNLISLLNQNLTCLSFAYRIGENNMLLRTHLPAKPHKLYMGICDYNFSGMSQNFDDFINDVLYEIIHHHFLGLVCDFESFCPIRSQIITTLDTRLHDKNIPFFVNKKYAFHTQYAFIIIDCGVSGGSLKDMLNEYTEKFTPERICSLISKNLNKFTVPSYTSDGEVLSPSDLHNMIETYSPYVFFSKEMACKYFTFMQDNQGYFVTFDDDTTLEYKHKLVSSLGIKYKFMYSDEINQT